jgi:hypothetical protein
MFFLTLSLSFSFSDSFPAASIVQAVSSLWLLLLPIEAAVLFYSDPSRERSVAGSHFGSDHFPFPKLCGTEKKRNTFLQKGKKERHRTTYGQIDARFFLRSRLFFGMYDRHHSLSVCDKTAECMCVCFYLEQRKKYR